MNSDLLSKAKDLIYESPYDYPPVLRWILCLLIVTISICLGIWVDNANVHSLAFILTLCGLSLVYDFWIWLLSIALVFGILLLVFNIFAALPISVAIILAAVILSKR